MTLIMTLCEYTHTHTPVRTYLFVLLPFAFASMGLSRGHKITFGASAMAVILVDYPAKWAVYLCSAFAINTKCISNAFRVFFK